MNTNLKINWKNFLRGCVAVLLVLLGSSCTYFIYKTRPRQIIGTLLRLENVPSSIQNADCESWGMTDVLTTCYFEIDPDEFPALLKGWTFRETTAADSSYSFASGPKVGPDFPVAVEFSTQNPPEFSHGGLVILVADGSRSRALLDYYEE